MPTDKRERQRAGREARREAARAAQRRAQRRRQIISIVGLLAIVGSIGVFISLSGGDGNDKVSTGSSSSSSTSSTASTEPKAVGTAECPPAEGAAEPKKSFDGPPKNCLTEGASYTAEVETDVGKFIIALDPKKAPQTVNSFVFLSRYGAYDDVPFHRVIPGFVVQGGDVEKGDGSGGPGYEFADELPQKGDYKVGSVAMANSGPNTNGSQFFVVTGDQGVQLPPSYSLFGEVTFGMEVVKQIEADGDPSGTPKTVHKIVKVTINEEKKG